MEADSDGGRWRTCLVAMIASAALVGAVSGCYSFKSSAGAGQTHWQPPRQVNPADVALPPGYRIEVVAERLTFPTGVTFDAQGRPVVVESGYAYGERFLPPRLLRLQEDGTSRVIVESADSGPWTGVIHDRGHYFVAAGNVLSEGRLLRVSEGGEVMIVVDGLPSRGDHHTNGPIVGPDGWIYFAQGTATNSGVVGPDNAAYGWLRRYPEFHDIPARDIRLAGVNFISDNPLAGGGASPVETGAFLPYGTPSRPGQVIPGQVKSSGSVLRVRPEGDALEVVAWGLRNPFGLAFAPDGRLFVTENAFDDRGSRPLWGAPDVLWQIEPGAWYGWPDFAGGLPAHHFTPPGRPAPRQLLAEHPQDPPRPRARFAVHASASGFDFARSEAFGHRGEAFVALFGDLAPAVGKVWSAVGCTVVRVDVETGVIADFAVNRGPVSGPASKIGGGGLERPVAARFSPDGLALYVVDFGVVLQNGNETRPMPETGVLWRIVREEQ